MADGKRSRTWLGIALILLAILGYGLFGARRYLSGPGITITSPRPGETVHGPAVEVRGVGSNLSYFYINDSQAYLEENGDFSFTYTPPPGDTIVTARGQDRFGRTRSVTVRFRVTN